jgi:hypothetical protein
VEVQNIANSMWSVFQGVFGYSICAVVCLSAGFCAGKFMGSY